MNSMNINYSDLINGITRFGSSPDDICRRLFGIHRKQIKTKVIIAPWWEPTIFPNFGKEVTFVNESVGSKTWNVCSQSYEITYIKTGIGAPVLTDVVLALGLTNCKKALFIGSVGSLDENIAIGDIVIPEYSICGDGTSRYLKGCPLKLNDPFGEKTFPNQKLFQEIKLITSTICEQNNVKYHIGYTFSIDTIFAQFAYIDEIISMGCNVIEMETAAAFRAAELSNIPLVALLSVSDNTVVNKSLISGRTENEINYREEVRKNIFPKIISEYFKD